MRSARARASASEARNVSPPDRVRAERTSSALRWSMTTKLPRAVDRQRVLAARQRVQQLGGAGGEGGDGLVEQPLLEVAWRRGGWPAIGRRRGGPGRRRGTRLDLGRLGLLGDERLVAGPGGGLRLHHGVAMGPAARHRDPPRRCSAGRAPPRATAARSARATTPDEASSACWRRAGASAWAQSASAFHSAGQVARRGGPADRGRPRASRATSNRWRASTTASAARSAVGRGVPLGLSRRPGRVGGGTDPAGGGVDGCQLALQGGPLAPGDGCLEPGDLLDHAAEGGLGPGELGLRLGSGLARRPPGRRSAVPSAARAASRSAGTSSSGRATTCCSHTGQGSPTARSARTAWARWWAVARSWSVRAWASPRSASSSARRGRVRRVTQLGHHALARVAPRRPRRRARRRAATAAWTLAPVGRARRPRAPPRPEPPRRRRAWRAPWSRASPRGGLGRGQAGDVGRHGDGREQVGLGSGLLGHLPLLGLLAGQVVDAGRLGVDGGEQRVQGGDPGRAPRRHPPRPAPASSWRRPSRLASSSFASRARWPARSAIRP